MTAEDAASEVTLSSVDCAIKMHFDVNRVTPRCPHSTSYTEEVSTSEEGGGLGVDELFNKEYMTEEEIAKHLQTLQETRNFDASTQAVVVAAFLVLISFGVLGNSLVCYVVAKNPRMRTPRNVFIINLAISDLTLCLFTQPFNLVKVLTSDWKLGRAMCKIVPLFAGTNVFVSTVSITAIALDRFQVIVYPTRKTMKKFGAVVALALIWFVSILLACPLLVFNDISTFELISSLAVYEVCVENTGMETERRIYSIASMLIQYIAPIVIVSIAHAQISRKLKYRMTNRGRTSTAGCNGASSVFQQKKSQREAKRKRKTNLLLVMIAVVFAASWMPLNVFNMMADFNFNLTQICDDYMGGLLFPVCHMLVLCSACANPLLYGWLNENFRREFVKVLCCSHCLEKFIRSGKGAVSRNSTTIDLTSRKQSLNVNSRPALGNVSMSHVPPV